MGSVSVTTYIFSVADLLALLYLNNNETYILKHRSCKCLATLPVRLIKGRAPWLSLPGGDVMRSLFALPEARWWSCCLFLTPWCPPNQQPCPLPGGWDSPLPPTLLRMVRRANSTACCLLRACVSSFSVKGPTKLEEKNSQN